MSELRVEKCARCGLAQQVVYLVRRREGWVCNEPCTLPPKADEAAADDATKGEGS